MCPMLWCRETFEDQTLALEHLSQCEWLSNAWYWCPQCSRPERFMGRPEMGAVGYSHVLHGKASKLKKAVKFFKSAWSNPYSTLTANGWSGDILHLPMQPNELADTSHTSLSCGEIDGAILNELEHYNPMLHNVMMHELPPYSPMRVELPTRLTHIIQHQLPLQDRKSLLETLEQNPTAGNQPYLAGDFDVLGAGVSSRDQDQTEERSQLHALGGDTGLSSGSELAPPAWKAAPFNDPPVITKSTVVYSTHTLSSIMGSCPLESVLQTQPSTQSYRDELYYLFCLARREWSQELSPLLEISSEFLLATDSDFFELGIYSLNDWYSGRIGNTFDRVFALIHIAWVFACMLYGDDGLYCWDELFQDMFHWQYAISNSRDQLVFARAIEKLSRSRQGSTLTFSLNQPCALDSSESLLHSLGQGRVMQVCSLFLKSKKFAR